MFHRTFQRSACLSVPLLVVGAVAAYAATPVILFSDLDSGPKTGGENNQGVFVCIYGKHFGNTRGTSTISAGGVAASAYKFWGASGLPTATDKACFQMGATTPSGLQSITMTVSGITSNTLPFTVRVGNVYFLDPANVSGVANDSNNGAVTAPWRTYDKAVQAIKSGDTVYVRASTTTTRSSLSARGVIVPHNPGTAGNNKAIVAYPGEVVVVGQDDDIASCSGVCHGIYSSGSFTTLADYWTFSGIEAHGNAAAIGFAGGAHLRIVANRATCPLESNWLACVYLSQSNNNSAVLGNEVFNVGTGLAAPGAIKGTHHLYFGTDDYSMEAGWNWIHTGHACRGIQIHSSPVNGGTTSDPTGNNLYDLNIHDNWVEDVGCDGINLATIDPSKGRVRVYNNVIKHAGTGNHQPDSGSYVAINIAGLTNRKLAGTGTWGASKSGLTISGSGTHFTTELQHGWNLVETATLNAWYIDQIIDDTHATVMSLGGYQGNDVPAGTPMVYQQAGTGNVEVYNNTIYDAGSCTGAGASGSTSCGAFSRTRAPSYGSPALTLLLSNNAIQQTSSEAYFANWNAGTPWTTYVSGTNNLYYGGMGTIPTTGNLTSSPTFISGSDFHLQASSPAINAALSGVLPGRDFDGVARPQSVNGSIGAYEGSSTIDSASICDLNGDGTVNSADVSLALDEALGKTACGNGSVISGGCDVVMVQRVILAVLGGVCRTGQ